MIDHQHGAILFECDVCSDVFEGAKDASFDATWSEAKKAGWSARKISENWEHSCPACGKDALL
jgi:hypothetical protein